MTGRYDLILAAEEALARQVALGVIVTTPQSVWHYLIPFMFIFDFLRRSSTMRRYTQHFMFPRKLAMDAARDIIEGEGQKERLSWTEEETRVWLETLNLYSPSLQTAQMKVVTQLMDHYTRLLQTEGDTYYDLVRNAYMSQRDYQVFLSQLKAFEQEVDRAIIERLGETEKLREKLLAEEEQLERMRKKSIDEIF
ncbi:MAG: NF038143 family protein [Desulfobacteraceae bacterium]|jgi:hypothetical protein